MLRNTAAANTIECYHLNYYYSRTHNCSRYRGMQLLVLSLVPQRLMLPLPLSAVIITATIATTTGATTGAAAVAAIAIDA